MTEVSLYGENGTLARFTRAATGIHDVAEKLRAQSTVNRARIVRDALNSLSNEPGCGHLFTLLAQSGTDPALAKLERLLK